MSFDAYRWLPLISTLSELYESRQERWRFTIFFLGEQRGYRPFGSPYFKVAGGGAEAGIVTAGLFGNRDFLPGAKESLRERGWRVATNKYQADFMLDREPGSPLAEGFWHGLGAVGTVASPSADDFLHCHLHDADESVALASFNPTAKGDYTYHHLDVPGDGLQRYREALAAAPLEPHLKAVLSASDREAFIASHVASIPNVAEWTDGMIFEAEAFGL